MGGVKDVGLADDWIEAGKGCEMAFWPVMTVPSSKPAEM